MKKKPWVVVGILLIFSGPLLVLTGVAYTLMRPIVYASSIRISVQEDAPRVNPVDSEQGDFSTYDPYFLRTQFEIIQSKPVLYEVINRLNLQKEWGMNGEGLPREVALRVLQNSITIYQQRDTSLIVISVTRTDPDEAAVIANELAETYRDSRMDRESRKRKAAIDKLDEALAEQQKRVDEAEAKVQEIRMPLDQPPQREVDALQLKQIQLDLLAAQEAVTNKEPVLRDLNAITRDNAREVAGRVTSDEMIVGLLQQLQDVDTRLGELDENLGPNHPDVERLANQRKQCEKVLMERLLVLRSRIQTEYQLVSDRKNALVKLLSESYPPPENAQSDAYRSYRKALADLESERLIYNQLKTRLRQQLVEMDVPHNPVEIIDTAEPSRRPVSPNLFMNALLSLVVGGPISVVGVVMLVLGLRGPRK